LFGLQVAQRAFVREVVEEFGGGSAVHVRDEAVLRPLDPALREIPEHLLSRPRWRQGVVVHSEVVERMRHMLGMRRGPVLVHHFTVIEGGSDAMRAFATRPVSIASTITGVTVRALVVVLS
jgi:hypothetical protein